MVRVRYTDGGTYRVTGEHFENGDEADVSEGLAEHLVDDVGAFERVGETDDDVHEEDGPPDVADLNGESGTLPFNPEEQTNDEIADKVADIDDAEALRAIRNLEEEQKDRTGAKDAIDDRLDDLEG